MGHLAQFNGGEIFLDANILLYELTSHPRFGISCHELIAKTEEGAVKSFISPFVITEVVHKLMIFETCDRYDLHMSAAITYLKSNPRAIKSLGQYRQALDLIYRLPHLTILTINPTVLRQSHALIAKYQLLSSDAIHAATCLAYGVHHIATNDKDFLRVKRLKVWLP